MKPDIRRNLFFRTAAISVIAVALAACSDSGDGAVKSANTDAVTTSASTSSVEVPDSQGTKDVVVLMEEGALPEMAIGSPDSPVTIIEYASMTCGHCANFHNNTYPSIKEKYVETGKVRFIMREFPFDPRAEAAFMLARCSGDNYFPMVDVLFKKQDDWARAQNAGAALLQISRLAGFTQESFEACLTNQELLDDIRAVRQRGANEFEVDATPTFYINGNKYSGALSVDEMSAIIDSML